MRRIFGKVTFRNFIIVFIAAVVMLSGFIMNSTRVLACDYSPGYIIEPRQESNVFFGKVLEVRYNNNGKDVYFEVFKVEKGNVKALIKVWTPYTQSACGVDFKAGEMYYVITMFNKRISTSPNQASVTTTRRLMPGEKIDNDEKIDGKLLLENFRKRYDASVSINGEDVAVSGPSDIFYVNKDNRVMVPLTEVLMNRFGIEYVLSNDTVTLKYNGLVYSYRVGFDIVGIGEEKVFMDTVMVQLPVPTLVALLGIMSCTDFLSRKSIVKTLAMRLEKLSAKELRCQ
ncbi:hypothetical protein [Paenibacillus lignilyticus]|uniref:Copper amine oxidase-like N-terminal domain-containing protein n=1 Tax=Paenibacillus lignilyticus TaxID=1172615 RepID=A0ABS5CDV5_9BACL|nr:hypothetical protein [Paenibacillus lignilyticus]MBP3964171.1 hypothetical protein [Paenibacillus lignilyticus]